MRTAPGKPARPHLSDAEHAGAIRASLGALRIAIADAEEAGLTVLVGEVHDNDPMEVIDLAYIKISVSRQL